MAQGLVAGDLRAPGLDCAAADVVGMHTHGCHIARPENALREAGRAPGPGFARAIRDGDDDRAAAPTASFRSQSQPDRLAITRTGTPLLILGRAAGIMTAARVIAGSRCGHRVSLGRRRGAPAGPDRRSANAMAGASLG
ncbi:MAG: hypothetical protein AAF317_13500, partial [Pseudomonadota bacterium]